MAELTSGINSLIQRIKDEGTSAGEAERDRLIAQAERRAAQILAEARQQADAMLADANKGSEDIRRRTESELRLAVRDFTADFSNRIRRNLIRPTVSEKLGEQLSSPDFLKTLLEGICRDFARNCGGNLKALIREEDKEALTAYFSKTLAEKLSLELEVQKGPVGFRLRREGEAFFWDFTQEAVAAELADLVEPALKPFFHLDHKGS